MRRAPKLPQCEKYEMYLGKPVAVLYFDEKTGRTEPCPFCSKCHNQQPEGHRATHCTDNITYKRWRGNLYEVKLTPDEIIAFDGTVLKREDGYIIRNRVNVTE